MNSLIISGAIDRVTSRFTQDNKQVTTGTLIFTTVDRGKSQKNSLKVTAFGPNLAPALEAADPGQEVTLEGNLKMNKVEGQGTVPELIVSRIHGVNSPAATVATPVAQKTQTAPDENLEDIPF